ncbi:uncharacterized protein LOC127794787 [Diospyros lotus]|uniref:uncharacterized protein LOC127794787 n=1 Tax=Diospyros lotus TaxID=55363 RepID=UPI00224E36D8|nr:uncharacterized protein LOC127794787 [Diospyros lotus]
MATAIISNSGAGSYTIVHVSDGDWRHPEKAATLATVAVEGGGRRLASMAVAAAKAYRQSEFNEYFIELERYAPAIGAYLREAGFSRWARAYSDGKRFDIMTTNIGECLNAALADAHKLPIQCLMEYIRNMLQQWFYERRGDASKMGGYITAWAEGEIGKRLALSRNWHPEPIDMYRFNVHDGHFGGIIDLKVRTYTCRVFDFDKLPCGHALAAARSHNIHPYSLCSSYYQTEALLCAYADPIMPVGSQAD